MILSQVVTIVSMFLVPFVGPVTIMLNCINYGCGFGCGHNVCLCINLLLPPGLIHSSNDKFYQYLQL